MLNRPPRYASVDSIIIPENLKSMEILSEYLQALLSTSSYELHLEPNKNPYVLSANGQADVADAPLLGTQISMMVFPLIPADVKQQLPNQPEIQFVHQHNLGKFVFTVRKSPAGFLVTVSPFLGEASESEPSRVASSNFKSEKDPLPGFGEGISDVPKTVKTDETEPVFEFETAGSGIATESTLRAKVPAAAVFDNLTEEEPVRQDNLGGGGFLPPIEEYRLAEEEPASETIEIEHDVPASADRRAVDRRKVHIGLQDRMDALLKDMAAAGASDLHLSVSMPPMVRKDGNLQVLKCDETTLSPEAVSDLVQSIMPANNLEEFAQRKDTDFAYEIPGVARFRCNVFTDRKGMGSVLRIIPSEIQTAEQLGLPIAITDLCSLSNGLVVVAGPAGSGKSTTLAAMIDSINKIRKGHIITLEDPIEYVHENKKCLVNQREVRTHTNSFKDALRAALREDPDVILAGEMGDIETISVAIEMAETGHLVFGALNTTTASSTVDRIIDQFPVERQQQNRNMLSETLKGVIAQTLLPRKDGGRVAAFEIMVVTPAVSDLIRDGKTAQIYSAIQTGKDQGMTTLNDAMYDLVQNGVVEALEAYLKSVDKTNFEAMLTRGGFSV